MSPWPTKRLRYLAEFNPPVPASVRTSAAELPLYSMEAVHEFGAPSEPDARPVKDLLSGYAYLEPTDVAYAKVTPCFENGKGLFGRHLSGPSFATTELSVLRPRPGTHQNFLAWILQSDAFRVPAIASMAGAGGLRRVSETQMRDLRLPAPSADMQATVSDYLDHETAEIDELVADFERSMSLLASRFDSIWHRMMLEARKCADTQAPLGRLCTSIVDGPFGSSLSSSHYTSSGAGVVRLANIERAEFRLHNRAYISLDYARRLTGHSALPGDLVIAALGDENHPVGRSAVIPETFGEGIVKADCFRARPLKTVLPDYVAWCLSSPLKLAEFARMSRGSTRARINLSMLAKVKIPALPLNDQRSILSRFGDARMGSRDASSLLARAIALAKERRAALITAAVTGQIDVTAKRRPAAEQLEDDIKELS